MSNIFLDSQNFVNSLEEAPDKLRAEIGTYYGEDSNGQVRALNKSTGKLLANFNITEPQQDDRVLIPIKTQRIYFYGNEASYRDQIQWRDYVKSIVSQNTFFVDHGYVGKDILVDDDFKNNYFRPDYEDLSKTQNTNLLLNYNLVNYKHNDKANYVKEIAGFRTQFDDELYKVDSDDKVKKLITEYPGRLSNYTGSLSEASERQRNIFILSDDVNNISTEPYYVQFNDPIPPPFPYQYEITISQYMQNTGLRNSLRDRKIDKFIHQAIKRNLTFQNVSFRNPEGNSVPVKIHNLVDMILTTDLVNFNKDFNELFLLEEDELSYDSPIDRFVNGVRAINFISDFRSYFIPKAKSLKQIYDSEQHNTTVIGYKIEKFIDNDLTLPTQTYFISPPRNSTIYNFIDTQLKYARKYIYKVSALVVIVGSSYQYTNLHVSGETRLPPNNDEPETVSPFMISAQDNSIYEGQDLDIDNSKKHRAFVDVQVVPSIQVAEIPIFDKPVMFYDQPTMPPQVMLYNQSGQNKLEVILKPNLNSSYDSSYIFKKLTDADELELERLSLSADNFYGTVFTSDYFTGRYEVYRMDTPPNFVTDFANNFLVEVDMDATVAFQSITPSNPVKVTSQRKQNNQIAHFEDDLIPNRKYYYLFRTLTYHGTPSNYTPIYEVELIQDSDETKINVSEYKLPETKDFIYRKMSKRIMKISPNFEHLFFTGDETNKQEALNGIGVLENKLLYNTKEGNLFKIRITSKHTGKKMDINFRAILKDETN